MVEGITPVGGGSEIQQVGALLNLLKENPGPQAPTLETIARDNPLKIPEAATGKISTAPYGGSIDLYA